MAFIIEIPNPFHLTEFKKHVSSGGMSIREWLEWRFPGFVEFPSPTICIRNGEALLRKEWDKIIGKDDVVSFVGVYGEGSMLVMTIIMVVMAVAMAILMPLPVTPGETPASDPVFSVKGRSNSIRLGEPIEVVYGKNRIYPAYASRPYYQYENNDQYQFSLFCLGQGEFEIETVQISDTAIASYQEASYEITGPGVMPTLFPINVYTSEEAGGQALYAYNQAQYVAPGWVGPFPSNPANTQTNKIQIDLNFPKGVYQIDKKGQLQRVGLEVEVEAREINDLGAPVGAYFPLVSPYPISVDMATNTPQRKTYSADVPLGRYEVRVRRSSIFFDQTNVGMDTEWDGMRAYLSDTPVFGNVTLVAVKIKATNNLNASTNAAFNVIATRKLPIYDSGGWTAPQATRSIVWAFVDAFKSVYGGRIASDAFFDLDALTVLDAFYEARGDYFDWIFRDPITVWEAGRAIARAGRATPLLVGSLITMKRDGPLDIPVAMFTPDNMVKGSFQWNVVLWEPYEYDSISVTYIEPATGYKEEQAIATLPGGTTDSPKEVKLPGISVRAQAYHEALYILASERYLRENITFDTGMEGHIPIFGDLIAISHDVPRWGQSGLVVHAEQESGDNYRIWLSEELDWSESGDYVMLFRGRPSTIIGPVSVEPTSDPKQVIVVLPDDTSGSVDFLLGGTTEPMLYLFGLSGSVTKYGKVVKVEPQGGETVRITAVNDEPIIHSFDDMVTPALNTPSLTPIPPDLPEIDFLTLSQIDVPLQIIQASWSATFGAQYYIIQTSEDGENWRNRGTTNRTSIQLQVSPGALWFRVAAVNNGQGPWKQETLDVGLIAGLDNYLPWNDVAWGIRWNMASSETGYRVDVYDNSNTNPVLKHTAGLPLATREFEYTFAMAEADGNINRSMLVTVTPLFVDDTTAGEAPPTSLELTNAVPEAPGSPASSFYSENSDSAVYLATWTIPAEEDLIRLKIWLSDTSGFDPNVDVPVIDEIISYPGSAGMPTSAYLEVPLDTSGGHAPHYWVVGIFDVWGNEILTNITAEQMIPAYP
jgi:hypothetical protein